MRRVSIVLWALLAAACGDPPHDNPFDPATPPTLQARARLSGAVTLESTGLPASRAGVHVSVPGTSLAADTDATGRYAISSVPPGTWSVQAVHAGFVDALVTGLAVTLDDGDKDVAVPTLALLLARGQVSGRMVLDKERSSGGVSLSLQGLPGAVLSDSAGSFLLSGVPVGTYTLDARKVGFQDTTVEAVTVGVAQDTALGAIPMPYDPGAIQGSVHVAGGAGSGGVTIRASGTTLNGSPYEDTTVDRPDGTYLFSGLPGGTYNVSFELADYATVSTAASIAPGQVTDLPGVSLVRYTGSVVGTATLDAGTVAGFPTGSDLSGVLVTIAVPGVAIPAVVTDASGAYRFDGVPVSLAGAGYTLSATKPSYRGASTSVTVTAGAPAAAPTLTLTVNGGSLTGAVQLWDDVAGAGPNATSAGAAVTVSGIAFNGASWTAAGATAADGSFTVSDLPPGSFDLTAASAGRTCTAFSRVSLLGGAAVPVGAVRCTDALAPGAVTLGAPSPSPGALAGYTNQTTVVVPIAGAASDPTVPGSNLRGYQLAVGSAPDWSAATLAPGQPASLTFSGLPRNGASTLWVRAVDWVGNAGPAASVAIVEDDLDPPVPSIATPRSVVNATTTSLALSGSESDSSFLGYEACAVTVAVGATCAASPTCSYASTSASFAVSLPASQQTCLWARAVDRAGNRSDPARVAFVSDLTPPAPPTFVPSYDPYRVSVRAPWVDFFVSGAATDAPGAGGPWQGIAWIEVDTGAGFQALCPQAACSAGGAWNPCACGCADARLRCDGTRFTGVRAPLTEGTSTTVAFRAVDVAGNVGAGVSQQVIADVTGDVVAATSALGLYPSARGSLVGFEAFVSGVSFNGILLDLGPNRRVDVADRSCVVTPSATSGLGRTVVPVHAGLVAFAEGYQTARIRRPGPDGTWCTADDVTTTVKAAVANIYVDGVVGTGEKLAWTERSSVTGIYTLVVREPGADGLVGTADDLSGTVATYNEVSRLSMGGGAILVLEASCGPSCSTFGWRVLNAGPTGSFLAGVTAFDVTTAVSDVALANDGKTLSYLEAGGVLVVRQPGPDGRYGTADDLIARQSLPWPVQGYQVATDGLHAVVTDAGAGGYLLHWWAGPDGAWGSADDVVERIHPSGVSRTNPALDGGLLVFQSGSDILDYDLTSFRWEAAPAATLQFGTPPLAANGTGTLFYKPQAGGLVARTAAGTETTGPAVQYFAARGGELVAWDGSTGISVYQPDATGLFFTGAAPAPVKLYATSSSIWGLTVGGGKAISMEDGGGFVARYKIFEPRGGTLKDVPTSGLVFDPYPTGESLNWAHRPAITARQAFFTCNGISTNVCVYGAGPDGRFGTADDLAATALVHPKSSARAGLAFASASLAVDGTRMLITEQSPPALYLIDAGPDGLFNTADDQERTLAAIGTYDSAFSVAGDWAVYLDVGGAGGQQVWQVSGFDGPPTLLSQHYAPKRAPVVDPQGRTFWIDGVMTPEGIFVRSQ